MKITLIRIGSAINEALLVVGQSLIRRGQLIYRVGMTMLIAAWPLLIATGVLSLPTWPAVALGVTGAGIGLGGIVLDVVRDNLEVS